MQRVLYAGTRQEETSLGRVRQYVCLRPGSANTPHSLDAAVTVSVRIALAINFGRLLSIPKVNRSIVSYSTQTSGIRASRSGCTKRQSSYAPRLPLRSRPASPATAVSASGRSTTIHSGI